MFKYSSGILNKIENILRESRYTLRYEKGHFKPGYCIVEEKRVVVVNKYYNMESKINSLVETLNQIDIDKLLLSETSKELYKQIIQQQQVN